MRGEPRSAAEFGHLTLVESRMLAFLACAAAAGHQVSANDLAAIPGPAGCAVGLREGLRAARDLMDGGWVRLPGLVSSGRHQPVPVQTPGSARSAVPRVVEKIVEVPVEKVVEVVTFVTAVPPPRPEDCVGRLGKKLPIPASLPDELRTELLALADEFTGGGPADAYARLKLIERRAAALEWWATLPQATLSVHNEAERIKTTLAEARSHPSLVGQNGREEPGSTGL
ncbi:hypothetical protein [Streptomyces sp. NPDC057910]|uniref:hypothetical protein n=1 Tax=Streptomyces sp. NPDC057910 TaxID=3346278 RepID=UPI0036E2EC23